MESFDKPPEVQIPTGTSEKSSPNPPEPPPSAAPPTPQLPQTPSATGSGWNPAILWGIGIAIIVGVALLIGIFGSGNSTPSYAGSGSSGGGGGGGYIPPAAPAYVAPPISKALDEKNGFKDFHFGMTIDEAKAVLEPTQSSRNPGANADSLVYYGTAVNRIGEFGTDSVGLQFFEGRLFRIDIRFSGNQNEIFEALKINYGEPFDNSGWTRGAEPLKAKCWMGEKTYAAIVAPASGSWDAIIIYDQSANQKALEYAGKEPERAAMDFQTNGFKSLIMGMRLEEIDERSYAVLETNEATEIKRIVINRGDLLTIGYYPLQYINCEFFRNRLYRIDLSFDSNRSEILRSIERRYGPLQNNDTWTRGGEKLTAKSAGDDNLYVTIVAPRGASGGQDWDFIVMMDYSIQREAEQFKLDSAKEAAKDFSTNGFKALVMGMRLEAVTADYTITDNNEVTGVKKILIRQGGLLHVGDFPLEWVTCEFFKDQLYRIDLEFNENRKEIYQIFENRFTPLQKNDTWTQGSERLSARSGGSDGFYGTILAPGGDNGGEQWETVVLLDSSLQSEAAQFKLDAPKRAAKDL